MKGFKNEIRKRWYLRWILLFSTWLFQGIVHADLTEKIYRITCTILFTAPFFYTFHIYTQWPAWQTLLVSLFIGHTINWFVNGNFSTIMIHRLFLKKTTKEDLFRFTDYLEKRTKGKPFIFYAAVFGSMSRGELKHSSDLDVSIVRKPGFENIFPALWEVFVIKKTADLRGVPLEIFLSDTPRDSIMRFREENTPVTLYDPEGELTKHYPRTFSIEEAKRLNHS